MLMLEPWFYFRATDDDVRTMVLFQGTETLSSGGMTADGVTHVVTRATYGTEWLTCLTVTDTMHKPVKQW